MQYSFTVTNNTTGETYNIKAENKTELRHKMINTLDMSHEYTVKTEITPEMVQEVKDIIKNLDCTATYPKYNRLNTVETRISKGVRVQIVKYSKVGTKREFFVAEYMGQRIGSTLWARKYDAVKVADRYIAKLLPS